MYYPDQLLIRTYKKVGTSSSLQPQRMPQSSLTNTTSLDCLQPSAPARNSNKKAIVPATAFSPRQVATIIRYLGEP